MEKFIYEWSYNSRVWADVAMFVLGFMCWGLAIFLFRTDAAPPAVAVLLVIAGLVIISTSSRSAARERKKRAEFAVIAENPERYIALVRAIKQEVDWRLDGLPKDGSALRLKRLAYDPNFGTVGVATYGKDRRCFLYELSPFFHGGAPAVPNGDLPRNVLRGFVVSGHSPLMLEDLRSTDDLDASRPHALVSKTSTPLVTPVPVPLATLETLYAKLVMSDDWDDPIKLPRPV